MIGKIFLFIFLLLVALSSFGAWAAPGLLVGIVALIAGFGTLLGV